MVTYAQVKNRLQVLKGILIIRKVTPLRTYYEKWVKDGNYYILEKRFYIFNSDPFKTPRSASADIKRLSEGGLIARVVRLCNIHGWEIC